MWLSVDGGNSPGTALHMYSFPILTSRTPSHSQQTPSRFALPSPQQFCDHLACDDHHRPLAPPVDGGPANRRHPLPRGGGVDGSGTGKPKFFLIVVVVIGLVILYASMALRRWSTSTRNDLRPAKRERVSRGSGRGESRSASAFATGVRGSSRQQLRQRRVTQALG